MVLILSTYYSLFIALTLVLLSGLRPLSHTGIPNTTVWFKHILFRRNRLGTTYNATMPSPEKYVKRHDPAPNHTCTHSQHNQEQDI